MYEHRKRYHVVAPDRHLRVPGDELSVAVSVEGEIVSRSRRAVRLVEGDRAAVFDVRIEAADSVDDIASIEPAEASGPSGPSDSSGASGLSDLSGADGLSEVFGPSSASAVPVASGVNREAPGS